MSFEVRLRPLGIDIYWVSVFSPIKCDFKIPTTCKSVCSRDKECSKPNAVVMHIKCLINVISLFSLCRNLWPQQTDGEIIESRQERREMRGPWNQSSSWPHQKRQLTDISFLDLKGGRRGERDNLLEPNYFPQFIRHFRHISCLYLSVAFMTSLTETCHSHKLSSL